MSDARFTSSAFGFSWIAADPPWMERASHGLVDEGAVWLVDPLDVPGLDDRVFAAGRPRAVLQLLSRHRRDCGAIAERLGVPLCVVPATLPGAPFVPIRVGAPFWRETALWWPRRRVLVVPEALGTAPYYRAPGEPVGVHPYLRILVPPRVLLGFGPDHLLVGHGRNLHAGVPAAIERAVERARRDLPRVAPRLLTSVTGRMRA
jgi:hypothetical protein